MEAIKRARAYLRKCDPAVAGQGGHDQLFKIACKLIHGFELSAECALDMLREDYNPRCEPPWSDKELDHKVHDAFLKGTAPKFADAADRNTKPVPPALPIPPVPQPGRPAKTKTALRINARRVDQIQVKAVEWLWPEMIPLGKLCILDGDPGLGKSTLLLDLAARVTTTGIMPDGSQGITGHVAVLSAEDGEDDTIKPRLFLAGADEARVHVIGSVEDGTGERPLDIPGDLDVLEKQLTEWDARLLIVDPLMAYLASGVDGSKDQDIRRCMLRLKRLAERCRCTIILLRHLNKGNAANPLYRGGGSIGIIGSARTGLLVGVDPDDADGRILAPVKSNLSRLAPSLKYRLELNTTLKICRVEWTGTSPHRADRLIQAPPTAEQREEIEEARTKEETCREYLREILRDGPVEVRLVKTELGKAGFAVRTVERAAKGLGVQLRRDTDDGRNTYSWELSGVANDR